MWKRVERKESGKTTGKWASAEKNKGDCIVKVIEVNEY